MPAISLIWKLDRIPPDSMQIKVQGYQWWWGFQYLDEGMQVDYGDRGPITVADVLVIPTNTTINLQLASEGGGAHDDEGNPDHMVIHSFWAPRLFGKQDVVPGLEARTTTSCSRPGSRAPTSGNARSSAACSTA